MPLSDTALTILNAAAQRDDRIAELPTKLPSAARNAVARSLLKQGLLEEVGSVLHLTNAGFRALNLEPPQPQDTATATTPHSVPQESPVADRDTSARIDDTALYGQQNAAAGLVRTKLRDVAEVVLASWDARETRPDNLATAMEQLRPVLAATSARVRRDLGAPRAPREGTKQQAVLALLRRDEGATIAQIVAATAWAQHTVRGFLANLKRKGITVEVLERVRQVGSGSNGAKGSYSIYRIADAG